MTEETQDVTPEVPEETDPVTEAIQDAIPNASEEQDPYLRTVLESHAQGPLIKMDPALRLRLRKLGRQIGRRVTPAVLADMTEALQEALESDELEPTQMAGCIHRAALARKAAKSSEAFEAGREDRAKARAINTGPVSVSGAPFSMPVDNYERPDDDIQEV